MHVCLLFPDALIWVPTWYDRDRRYSRQTTHCTVRGRHRLPGSHARQPNRSSTCPSGLSRTRHLQLCFLSASTSLLAGPCILPGLLARLLEAHRPGFLAVPGGVIRAIGPPKRPPGRLAKLCFWLSVQPALLGRHALRASGGPGPAVPRVELRQSSNDMAGILEETQPLLETVRRAT